MKKSFSRRPCARIIIALIIVATVACASVAHYERIDDAVSRNAWQESYSYLEESKKKAYPSKDMILYYLDAGLLAHYAQDFKASSKHLHDAERAIEAAFTKSISLEVSTYLVNDTTQEYPGEDYEDIYLNVIKALNYYHEGSTEGALVEIRRIDNKLKYLSTKYGAVITNAQKAALSKSEAIPADTGAARSNFTSSALARYLSMLFYRSEGNYDAARIDRDYVKIAFANHPSVYKFPLPSSLDDELVIPSGKARLNVISFNGFSPIKEQSTNRIQISSTNWVKFALPKMIQRPSIIAYADVILDSGEVFPLEVVEDIGAVATETFKNRSSLIYFKTVLRAVTKAASSVVLKEQSGRADSAEQALLLGALSFGSQLYAEASEQADLRIARYFPAKALVGGITLSPGEYSFSVRYFAANGTLVYQKRFEKVKVRENMLNLSEAVCIR